LSVPNLLQRGRTSGAQNLRRPAVKSLGSLSPGEDRQLVDAAPEPIAVQAAEDDWQMALAALTTPTQVAIAQLLRHGLSQSEVVERLQISEWTVRRVVNRITELLKPCAVQQSA